MLQLVFAHHVALDFAQIEAILKLMALRWKYFREACRKVM